MEESCLFPCLGWSSIPTELCEAEAEVDGGESEGGQAAAVGLQGELDDLGHCDGGEFVLGTS